MNNFINELDDNTILIIPNNLKEDILKYIRINKKDLNIKIFNMEEFINKLTFSYDEKTIYEVMKKFNTNYNISKLYLNNIKYVNSESNNYKLNKLYEIKKYTNDFLIKDKLFFNLIKNKKVIVYGYSYITKYNQNILNMLDSLDILNIEHSEYIHDILNFKTIFDECIYVVEKILELIDSKVDINNIFISNLDDTYRYVFNRLSKLYDIPINLNIKTSIYETNIGKYFIKNLDNNILELLERINNTFNMNNSKNYDIYKKIISIINKFYFTNDYLSIKENIIETMKNTFITDTKYINAVNEINIINNIITNEKYIFLVGFNQDKFPNTIKDEDYINDDIKPNIMEKSYEMNLINKEIYYNSIKSIKNLYISYAKRHLNETLYPSILIEEYNMNDISYDNKVSKYSNDINKVLFVKDLDKLIKYNDISERLGILNNNYNVPYNTYDNKYSGINKTELASYLNNNLKLSYSSMDTYYHCQFKYYLKYILKIDKYEDKLGTYIGNLYHHVLSNAFKKDFSFDICVNDYINNNPYPDSYKNRYFIKKVVPNLKKIIDIIKKQHNIMDMDHIYYEKEVNIYKNSKLNIIFTGYIDKMLKKDKYVVIVDYKTYMLDIKLNYLPYGLSMQLPVYLYLTKNIDKNNEIIGIYLQQVLFNKFNKDNNKSINDLIDDNLKLKGYSIGNEEKLSIFDKTYMDSELIHGMKLNNKGFSHYSKVLTEKQINNIYLITDKKINECISGIENAIFNINPKKINDKIIGCDYCMFNDICYKKHKDIEELEDIKDLSFLD